MVFKLIPHKMMESRKKKGTGGGGIDLWEDVLVVILTGFEKT